MDSIKKTAVNSNPIASNLNAHSTSKSESGLFKGLEVNTQAKQKITAGQAVFKMPPTQTLLANRSAEVTSPNLQLKNFVNGLNEPPAQGAEK
jgi:hypothetical protein